jgi:hypothetical protein
VRVLSPHLAEFLLRRPLRSQDHDSNAHSGFLVVDEGVAIEGAAFE